MSSVKDKIIGAVTIMSEQDANKVWNLIINSFSGKDWSNIPEVIPDEIDLAMLSDIKNNPECQEFVSYDETMKLLGL